MLSGWAGGLPLGVAPDMAFRYVRGRGPENRAAVRERGAAAAPSLASDGRTIVAVRGDLIWRAPDPALVHAESPAHAVLAAYRQRGRALLDVLSGAFAIAVLEIDSGDALLAIDRMGAERLTFASLPGTLVFSTSAEWVARFPGRDARLRPQALLDYLFFRVIPSPGTIFDGVRKLPAAGAIEWKNGIAREFRYWKPTFALNGGEPFESLKQSLHAALETAVRANRPGPSTGAFLSGGLDSATIAGMLARVSSRPPKTFSVGFGFPGYDERAFARMASRHFGCLSHEHEVRGDDIVDIFPRVAAAYDEPFGNASAIPTYACARLAAGHGVDHLLAGDGGDEIFAGNRRYAEQSVFERYHRVPRTVRAFVLEPVLGHLPRALQVSVLRKGRNFIAHANTPLPDRFENWNLWRRFGFETILHPDLLQAVSLEGPFERMRDVYRSAPDTHVLNRMLYYDWSFTLADNDLRKVGRMCELAGVRVSYPMLHPDVVDVSLRVPAKLKMRGAELRTFYKRAMNGFLPDAVIRKPKHGFGLPFGLWLQRSRPLAALIGDELAGLRARHVVRPEFIDRVRRLHAEEDPRIYGVCLYTLAMLEGWFEAHAIAP